VLPEGLARKAVAGLYLLRGSGVRGNARVMAVGDGLDGGHADPSGSPPAATDACSGMGGAWRTDPTGRWCMVARTDPTDRWCMATALPHRARVTAVKSEECIQCHTPYCASNPQKVVQIILRNQ
jgi:hypothetical protein